MPIYRMPNPSIQSPSKFEVDDLIAASADCRRQRTVPRYWASGASGNRELVNIEIRALVVDGSSRRHLYDRYRLLGVIRGLRQGVQPPPIEVTRHPGNTFRLEDGFHRFLACVLLGVTSLPVAYATSAVPRYRCA